MKGQNEILWIFVERQSIETQDNVVWEQYNSSILFLSCIVYIDDEDQVTEINSSQRYKKCEAKEKTEKGKQFSMEG